jgi:hypothetical protein
MEGEETTMMDLRLAVAESCTVTGCRVVWLDGGETFVVGYSEPMLMYAIRVHSGQLVVVDQGATPPQLVFRLDEIAVTWESGRPMLTRDGELIDADGVAEAYYPEIRERYA